jgi:hypothetical protein
VRQIGVFSQHLEKTRLVRKFTAAREHFRQVRGKCEGRKPHAQTQPDLHRANPNTGKRRSSHKISAEIAAVGLLNDRDIRGRHCGGRGGGQMWSRICH